MSSTANSDRRTFKKPENLRALIFDVDGTLYRQKPVQRLMLKKLLSSAFTDPFKGVKTLKILSTFRKSQEHLREQNLQTSDLARAQLQLTAIKLGCTEDEVQKCVEKWMESAPLPLLAQFLQTGIMEFLQEAAKRSIQLAVCSDYPAHEKLRAMKLDGYFDTMVCAQDQEVGVFKPDPKGILTTLKRLGVAGEDALYIGDRADVDAPAAYKAGLHCVLITQKVLSNCPPNTTVLRNFTFLQQLLFSSGETITPCVSK